MSRNRGRVPLSREESALPLEGPGAGAGHSSGWGARAETYRREYPLSIVPLRGVALSREEEGEART